MPQPPHVLKLQVPRLIKINVGLRDAVYQQHPRVRPVEVAEQLDAAIRARLVIARLTAARLSAARLVTAWLSAARLVTTWLAAVRLTPAALLAWHDVIVRRHPVLPARVLPGHAGPVG
jgi:hypothetical protein